MTDTFQIRPARAGDLPAILGLIDSAATWLRTYKHTDQWARPWPDKAGRDARVEQGIADGLTWIVEDSPGRLAATVTCREHGHDKLWTQQELAEPAAYVSRLIVSRELASYGIGAALIDWAGLLGARNWAASCIRVDVWTTNHAVHDYYRRRGFTHLRTLDFEHHWDYPSAALFQKPTAAVDPGATERFDTLRDASITSH